MPTDGLGSDFPADECNVLFMFLAFRDVSNDTEIAADVARPIQARLTANLNPAHR
jgi:hypothetical protein